MRLLITILLLPLLTSAQQPLGLNLENYTYPYPVKYITLHLQQEEIKMAYMDVRPDQPNGHTVLLLHGKNFCGSYWGPTAKALAAKGFRVIIPDQVGFGKSSKPQHLQYSFHLLAQNTKAVLDSAQVDKVIVLGHSIGGMIATRFTLMYPNIVEKFILEDPIGLEDWRLQIPYQNVEASYQSELKQTRASIKKYMLENYFHGLWRSDYDELLTVPAGWTLNPDYPRIAFNSALTSDMLFTQPVCYEFSQVKAPSLLIIGQLDRTAPGRERAPDSLRQTLGDYPALGKLTQQKIPNCQLITIPGVGHIPHVEAFDTFMTSLLNFLVP